MTAHYYGHKNVAVFFLVNALRFLTSTTASAIPSLHSVSFFLNPLSSAYQLFFAGVVQKAREVSCLPLK